MSILFAYRMPNTAQSAKRHLIVFDDDERDNEKMTGRQLDRQGESCFFSQEGLLVNESP